ncbi:MAG: NifU family protein [Solirubrobacteraceae bacterium]
MGHEAIVAITQTALDRIRSFSAELPDGHALWVRVSGSADREYTYALTLSPRSGARDTDVVQHLDDLVIVLAGDSIEKLRGATIDWSEAPQHSGFTLVNPNKPPALASLPTLPMSISPGSGSGLRSRPPAASSTFRQGSLDNDLARRVMIVLDRDVNPNIAAHGGRAELAGIEGQTAYLRLGGGCQGCGMASVTLSQGIEIAITQAVPEIVHVVDVTDHASGTNPYFEAAKK